MSDFAEWDTNAQMVLLFAMFIGGCVGSTGGGVKIIRWLVILKTLRQELFLTVHPSAIRPVRLAGTVVDEDVIRGLFAFPFLYLFLFGFSAVFLSLDSARIGYSLTTLEAVSASLATLGNIGPGFSSLRPFGSYLKFSDASKLLMIFLMWVGCLEIVLVSALLLNIIEE